MRDNIPTPKNNSVISTEVLTRNLKQMTIYVHELLDIKKEIKKGIPINWALRLFWSMFCMCFGDIIKTSLIQDNFIFKNYISNLNIFVLVVLVTSFLLSILLLFLSKSQGSAADSIDQILKQHGIQP